MIQKSIFHFFSFHLSGKCLKNHIGISFSYNENSNIIKSDVDKIGTNFRRNVHFTSIGKKHIFGVKPHVKWLVVKSRNSFNANCSDHKIIRRLLS